MSQSINIDEIKIGDIVTFSCYGNGVIADVSDGEVIGTVSASGLSDAAVAATNHANIYSALPAGEVEDDYQSYHYFRIKLQNDQIVEIGSVWIEEFSLNRRTRNNLTAVIEDFDATRVDEFRELCVVNGFTLKSVVVTPSE